MRNEPNGCNKGTEVEVGQHRIYIENHQKQLDEQRQLITELRESVEQSNRNFTELNHLVRSTIKPFNDDVRELKKFAKDFNRTKFKVLGGLTVIVVAVGSIWTVAGSVLSKYLAGKVG